MVVKETGSGILGKSRVEKGFVITHVNDQPIKNTEEFYEALKKLTGATVKLSGVYPGFFGNYAFGILHLGCKLIYATSSRLHLQRSNWTR